MKELNNYDVAAQNFYRALQINSFPIDSLDWYGVYFDKVAKGGYDINILNQLAAKYRWQSQPQINQELFNKEHVIVVTDSHLKIVHASHNISEMNGYAVEEIIGKSPKMFQGALTCKVTSNYISNAIKNKHSFEAVLTNYRKDGSAYKCWIKGEPLFNEKGKVVHFIAYEKEVA